MCESLLALVLSKWKVYSTHSAICFLFHLGQISASIFPLVTSHRAIVNINQSLPQGSMGVCTYMHSYTQAHMYKQISLKDAQCHNLTKFQQRLDVSSSVLLLWFFQWAVQVMCITRTFTSLLVVRFCIKHVVLKERGNRNYIYIYEV